MLGLHSGSIFWNQNTHNDSNLVVVGDQQLYVFLIYFLFNLHLI